MTLEIGLLFALLVTMVVLFLTEKLPVDLTAFAGLTVLVLAGYVRPDEAFAGFASPAVITMLSVFFVSAALQYTGIASAIGARIHRVVGSRETLLIVAVMVVAGLLSAFMNNIAATAVLMPAVVSLSRQAGLSPGRLLMPLAFGAILGGTTTLVGTPPNLLTSEVLLAADLRPFRLFDFAPYGLALLGAGVLFMVTVGRRLLPSLTPGMAESERADLAGVYRLGERLFALHLPEGSPLAGKTLAEARFGETLGVQVVAIDRQGGERLAPSPGEPIRVGDTLIVEGRSEDLEHRLELQGLELDELGSLAGGNVCTAACGLVVRLREGSPLSGRTISELRFRSRFGLVVADLHREGEPVRERLNREPLRAGDELLALGPTREVHVLAARPDIDVVEEGPAALRRLGSELFVLRIGQGSPLAGLTLGELRLRRRIDLTAVAAVRGDEAELAVDDATPLVCGDRLLVTGPARRIARLIGIGQLEVDRELPARYALESAEVGLAEAVVAPRSHAVGQSLRELGFRKKYGMRVLALWRGGQPIRTGLADLRLRLGDGLLLHGPREKVSLLEADPDFVVLTAAADQGPSRPDKAPFALGGLLLMIGLVISGLFPIQVAAFAAATFVVLTRALKMQEAYRAVEWRAVFLVAAILPVGVAMERTGAAGLVAATVAGLAGDAGPYAVLVALMLLSSLLSQGLDGAPTVVLLAPVVISTANQLGLSPYPLMMGVGLAASAAFMTPFSHKANLLVMGAGGYRTVDYLRVGTPLTVVVLGLLAVMIPLLMPLEG